MTEVQAVWCCSKCGAVYHKDFSRCPNDGAEVVLAMRDPLIGSAIGHYVVEDLVGEGGMGRVYIARHANLPGRRYAVKVLLGDVAAHTTMRKRFTNEAERTSRLDHPNIVHVIDYGTMSGGLPYIVMDYIDGLPLTDLINVGRMAAPRVIRLARAICEGLAYAHDAGVVHRDLKPDNVLVEVGPDGIEVPRIADFGLAVTNDPKEARLTTTGMAMGTPAYSAPEQMAGRRVDHRADLYALGVTMFEMLTGGLPFEGAPMEIVTAKAHDDPKSIAAVTKQAIPDGLQVVVDKLIRRKAEDRYDDARQVIAALDDVVLGLAVDPRAATANDSRTMTPVPVLRPRIRRAWLLPALVATAGAFAAGVWWQLSRSPPVTAKPAVVHVVADLPAPAEPAQPVPEPPPTAVVVAEPVVAPPARQPAHHRTVRHQAPREARQATEPVSAPVAAPPPVVPPVIDSPKPIDVPAPPPAPPLQLYAKIAGVDVHGSLPVAVVQRAVSRTLQALDRCAPPQAQTVIVHLTIGESRRAESVSATGGSAASCVAGVFGALRTEAAPDVGDVSVTILIAFAVKT